MYNKIFTKILDSSIWLESNATRIVWMTFLAAMDEEGMCQFASVANVAHRARVELEEAKEAIQCLEEPDENSSDPDNDGRRIERVPGGWIVLNAAKYREIVTRVSAKEKNRERVARHRERKRDVMKCNDSVMQSVAYAEAYAEAEAKREEGFALVASLPDEVSKEKKPREKKDKADLETIKTYFLELGLPNSDAEWFFYKNEGNGWTNGRAPIKDWKATVRSWKAAKYLPSQKTPPVNGSTAKHFKTV